MPTLREIDAMFAEKVLMNFVTTSPDVDDVWLVWEEKPLDGELTHFIGNLPHYTHSLDAAWEGVEKIMAAATAPESFHLSKYNEGDVASEGWCARFACSTYKTCSSCSRIEVLDDKANSESPAIAVVRACLAAVGVPLEETEVTE